MTNASDEIIIIGDFNLPGISWSSSCNGFLHIDMERSSLHSHASKLLDYYSTATLRQINHVTNENNRSLDLCFVSAQDAAPLILHAPSPLVKVVNHHPSLILKLNNTRANVVASIEPIIYNFHNADHHSIAEFFATLDWVDILGGCDAENAALTLSHIIGHVIERHVPKKIVAPNSCPWQTRQLRRMKTAKRAALKRYSKHGPDGIPSAFLKRHIELLLAPFQLIFNKSLSSGLFPSVWKTATMFPVYKKGDRKDVNKHRGISSLCAASKLFELVITEPLISHCKQHLSADQHGLISGRSTTTNLLCLTSSITDSFVQLYALIRSISDAMDLQQDINSFAAWCTLNRMVVNPTKCSVISFTRVHQPIIYNYELNGIVIQRVNCIKDLGVILDTQLTFKHHVSYVIEKASRTLGFIFRVAKGFTDVYCLKSLYCSLVRSTLEYCSAV
ncbi:uncharacterized protein LOC134209859 [Armigeres subalbatus]|uniref:uncharacterized protein LOC134209859 n=1 Tax=Armigeres subalbatus TaxID=124917 RepID=UPI002ED628AD